MPILKISDYKTPVALVTGGAKRVGRAMVLQLAEMGFDVAIHYFRSEMEANDLLSLIRAKGGKGYITQSNLDSATSAAEMFRRISREFGTPSVLVNNASIFIPERFETFDVERLGRNVNLHLTVPLVLSHLMVAALKTLEVDTSNSLRESLIVNMLDQRVLNASPGFVSYNASKCALAGATKSLAIELAPNTRLNGIAPGPVLPPPNSDGAGFDDYCSTMPLNRGSSPEEIAHLLKFLVESGSLTGQIIASDGGQHLGYLSPQEALRNERLNLNKG